MARYEHLPIYKKSFELAVYLEQVSSSFSQQHRHTRGARLQSSAQGVPWFRIATKESLSCVQTPSS